MLKLAVKDHCDNEQYGRSVTKSSRLTFLLLFIGWFVIRGGLESRSWLSSVTTSMIGTPLLEHNETTTYDNNSSSNSNNQKELVVVENKDRQPDATTGTYHSKKQGKFAYAYTIAGCDNQDSCVGYILNALVAARILSHYNSTSDVVFLVRMASWINETRLPSEQEEWLTKAGVKLVYVPKLRVDSFPTATLEKFRTLELLQYDRVRFFDSDLIPLCSLDHEFQDSFEGPLQGFVGIRGGVAPITACSFIVTPQPGLFERTMDLIRSTRQRNNGKWDPYVGFGHRFLPGETWRGMFRAGNHWDFYGSSIDQGLLFQLFKFEIGNWSDISYRVNTAWEETNEVPPDGFNTTNLSWAFLSNGRWATPRVNTVPWTSVPCFNRRTNRGGQTPVQMEHFAGSSKPWRNSVTSEMIPLEINDFTVASSTDLWFYWLGVANRTWDLQLPSVLAEAKGTRFNPMPYDGGRNKNVLLGDEVELPRPILENVTLTEPIMFADSL